VIVMIAIAAFFKFDPRRAGAGHQVDAYEDAIVSHVEHDPMGVAKKTFDNLVKLTEQQAPQALFGFEFGPRFNSLAVVMMLICGLLLIRRRVMWGACGSRRRC